MIDLGFDLRCVPGVPQLGFSLDENESRAWDPSHAGLPKSELFPNDIGHKTQSVWKSVSDGYNVTSGTCSAGFLPLKSQHGVEIQAGTLALSVDRHCAGRHALPGADFGSIKPFA